MMEQEEKCFFSEAILDGLHAHAPKGVAVKLASALRDFGGKYGNRRSCRGRIRQGESMKTASISETRRGGKGRGIFLIPVAFVICSPYFPALISAIFFEGPLDFHTFSLFFSWAMAVVSLLFVIYVFFWNWWLFFEGRNTIQSATCDETFYMRTYWGKKIFLKPGEPVDLQAYRSVKKLFISVF